jgi:hypothetical protein
MYITHTPQAHLAGILQHPKNYQLHAVSSKITAEDTHYRMVTLPARTALLSNKFYSAEKYASLIRIQKLNFLLPRLIRLLCSRSIHGLGSLHVRATVADMKNMQSAWIIANKSWYRKLLSKYRNRCSDHPYKTFRTHNLRMRRMKNQKQCLVQMKFVPKRKIKFGILHFPALLTGQH